MSRANPLWGVPRLHDNVERSIGKVWRDGVIDEESRAEATSISLGTRDRQHPIGEIDPGNAVAK
jgi:hypothetical protein